MLTRRRQLEVWIEGLGHLQRQDGHQHEVPAGGQGLLPRQQLRHSQRLPPGTRPVGELTQSYEILNRQ